MSADQKDPLEAMRVQLAEQTRSMLYLQAMYYHLVKKHIGEDFKKVEPHYGDGITGRKFSGQLLEIEHLVYLVGYMNWLVLNKSVEDASRIFGNISILAFHLNLIDADNYFISIGFPSNKGS